MQDPVEKLEDYYNGLMTIAEKSVTSEEEGILLAGAMMAVAKILYHKNLSEDQFGYSAFGLKNTISRSGLDYLKAYKEKFFL